LGRIERRGHYFHPKLHLLSNELTKSGVKMYECGVAMRLKGYTTQDILPYGRVVVSGIGAMVDFEKSGYLSITP
jgi:intracellular sulfur oxidation DsrE/DsrF family protein